jgi:hypothetical protein
MRGLITTELAKKFPTTYGWGILITFFTHTHTHTKGHFSTTSQIPIIKSVCEFNFASDSALHENKNSFCALSITPNEHMPLVTHSVYTQHYSSNSQKPFLWEGSLSFSSGYENKMAVIAFLYSCTHTSNTSVFNPLKPNDLWRRRAVSPLKIKIPSKYMHEKPTNTPIIHSVY